MSSDPSLRRIRYVPGSGGGGGGVLSYISYIGMCRPKGYGFLSRFGLKTGIDFDHYGLKSGMVFKGTTRAYKRMCLFNSKGIVEKRSIQNISFELNFRVNFTNS